MILGLLIAGVILTSGNAAAATLSWSSPTTYTDSTPILTADQARITYTPYTGTSAAGPWTARPSTSAGATSATVPDPAIGTTMYYTLDCTLDGQTSAKAVAVSKTLFKVPGAPLSITVQ